MTNAPASTIIAEGKTKIIYATPDQPNKVLIWSKDDITAGDGAQRDVLDGKSIMSNRTTCNCFRLLSQHGIPTHFISEVDAQSFRAYRADMIPLELVARRIATGSFLKRHPDIPEGTRFDSLVIEFFEKDDYHHDPLVIFDTVGQRLLRYSAKLPLQTGFTAEQPLHQSRFPDITAQHLAKLREMTEQAFLCLEKAWQELGVVLVDLKIECGIVNITGEPVIVVADVIDNDSWRIWPGGRKEDRLDKQAYRDLAERSPENLRDILANYATVTAATEKFVEKN